MTETVSDLHPHISTLVVECDRQIENPPFVNGKPERYIPMFAQAVREAIQVVPEAQTNLIEAINFKLKSSPFPSQFVFNSLLRNAQRVFMYEDTKDGVYNDAYPFATQDEWNERVYSLVSNEEKFTKLAYHIWFWNVGSDVETRVAGPKLVAHTMMPERVSNPEDPIKILNIGSARDHALAMLSANLSIPEIALSDERLDPDQRRFLQKRINELLAKEVILGETYGVDMWPLKDPEWSYFLEACRYYPSELLDEAKRCRYQQLERIRDADPKLHHTETDYSVPLELIRPGTDEPTGISTTDTYDMVVFSTCLYQSYKEKQLQMFDNAQRQLKEGGKIVVQDFCEISSDENALHTIETVAFNGPNSKPYTYTTFVFDSAQPDKGLQPFGFWNNGRCEAVKLGVLGRLLLEKTQ